MFNSETKLRIEKSFEQIGAYLFYNPKKVLFILFSIIGVIFYHLPSLKIDTSVEALLHKNDPLRVRYDSFREEFGKDEMIIIAVRSDNIFTRDFLIKLKKFHQTIEKETPYIHFVTSLANARDVYGKNDVLHIEELLEGWPENGVTVAQLEKKILNNPVYIDNLISKNGDFTILAIEIEQYKKSIDTENVFSDLEFDTIGPVTSASDEKGRVSEEDIHEAITQLEKIAANHINDDFEVFIAGTPVVADSFIEATISDAGLTSILALSAITFFLIIVFKRVSGVFLSWVVVLCSLFSVFGIMAMFNVPVKLTTTVIPSFILAVGVGDSVHILTIFYERFGDGYKKVEAIAYALGHSGLAIVLTSLTTAIGLLSFSFAKLAAISDVGIFTAAGVMLALFFSICMIPAFVAILPIKPLKKKNKENRFADKTLNYLADFSYRHGGIIVGFSLILLVVSITYTLKLNFFHDVMTWLPDSMPVKTGIKVIDKEFNGSVLLEVVIDTKKKNGLYDHQLINAIEKASAEIEKIESDGVKAGKVTSLVDLIKESNKALHDNDSSFYTIPQNNKEIAEIIFLFECSDSGDLERITDSELSKTRITIKTPSVDALTYKKFIERVSGVLYQHFGNDNILYITGMGSLLAQTISATLRSIANSYLIAFGVIAIMLIILVNDIKLGLVAMVPNFLPIIVATGYMGYRNIPMDMCTIMVGSIAIGLVVDDTLHFMYNFQRYFHQSLDGPLAVRKTLLTTGRAILFTSLILSSGFYVVMFATLQHTTRFGFLLGTIVLLAVGADFVITSAIVILVTRKKQVMAIN